MSTNTDPLTARERQAAIAAIWARQPTWSEEEVVRFFDDELKINVAKQAEIDRYTDDLGRSFTAMFACPVCGESAPSGGLCDDCARTRRIIEDERAAAKTVRGEDRRGLVTAWMER